MNISRVLLLTAGLVPAVSVQAWSPAGQDFSGELVLSGEVTQLRNPWVWTLGDSLTALESAQGSAQSGVVSLPSAVILRGQTKQPAASGREGLAPKVSFGQGLDGFSLSWVSPGIASVTLPVAGDGQDNRGSFTFRMAVAAVLHHGGSEGPVSQAVYNDLTGNGLPGRSEMMPAAQTAAFLQALFGDGGPVWLKKAVVLPQPAGLGAFTSPARKRPEGVYGAGLVAGSGRLTLTDRAVPAWQASLPVSIEYQ